MVTYADANSIADVVSFWAKEMPDKIAQVFEGRSTTFAELDRNSSLVAAGLRVLGIGSQDRIAYLDKNSDLYFELLYGSSKAGSVVVGINWRLAAPEVAYILNDSSAKILFVGPEFAGLIREIQSDIPNVTSIISMEGADENWLDFQAWRDSQNADQESHPQLPEDVAIQLYTSGTTGHPKGVELTNANYVSAFRNFTAMDVPEMTSDDVAMVCMPVFHVAGVNMGLIGTYAGTTNVITREVNPPEILELVEKYKVTMAIWVPAVIRFLLLQPEVRDRDLSSLRTIFYGASPISLDVLKQAMEVFGCEFVQLYGLTETTGQATYLPAADHDPEGNERMRSCGITMPNLEISVMDTDGQEAATGDVGEVWIRGDAVMKGYFNNPAATLESIDKNGWFKSGDIGYLDKDGYLYIYDRVKDMIVSGGENVYPAEVENALMDHEAVSDAAVIGVPDDQWGEAVKGVVVLHEGAEASEEDIISFAKKRIAGFKTPKSIDFVAELPRNPSGKILKRVLREPYWKDLDRQVG